MNVAVVKEVLHRVQTTMHSIHPQNRQTYTYEHRDDGSTVTWRFKNALSPQQVQRDVETGSVWLWSLKDYLKEYLSDAGRNPQDVEAHVDSTKFLPILADVANSAKHGNLRRSRSGRFAYISGSSMSVNSKIQMQVSDASDAEVEVILGDAKAVKYKIPVLDQNNKYVGDGIVLLRNALVEWRRFIRKQPGLNAILK